MLQVLQRRRFGSCLPLRCSSFFKCVTRCISTIISNFRDFLCSSMKGMVLTPHAYNPIIQALFRRKRANEAIRLYREMLEKGDPPDAITYKIVFRGLCNGGGPIGEAIDFVVEMIEQGFLPEFSAFYMLAEGVCALSMEDTLIKLVNMVMEKAHCSDSEVSMIRGFLRIRKFQDALGVLGNVLDSRKQKKPSWSKRT